ncbi:MAG TPA: hypothetical protein PLO65_02760 [Caulobacter sp.]|nr:hypothetical protein [Caulobacter sp.]
MGEPATNAETGLKGLPVGALALEAELAGKGMQALAPIAFGGEQLEPRIGRDGLWFFIGGRLALRTAWGPGGDLSARRLSDRCFEVESSLGRFVVDLALEPQDRLLRVTTRFTPARDLLAPDWPRDLYVLNGAGRPCHLSSGAGGRVEAAQRGLNVGLVFFTLRAPDFGTVMYLQNLTALNDWFRLTGTTPDGVVGGEWPELGYRPKAFTERALPAGETLVLSDVLLTWTPRVAEDDAAEADHFLTLLAKTCRRLDDAPPTQFRDWPDRCARTLRHLARSPKATIRHYGHTYLHPYTAAEYPDCMVQLSVAQSLHEYAVWRGRPVPLEARLLAGTNRFYDPQLGTLRRYLPNVGDDKNADEVDSWYLYHPLLNLGRLALAGDAACRRLFFDCIGFAIRAARHFRYDWPIKFDVRTLEVITADRGQAGVGQSDVGGIYAYVMLLAHDLTGEARYREEAVAALRALKGWRFELLYQANLSAWGAAAAVRLWRDTGDERFLGTAKALLAGVFHNSLMWESQIGAAVHYPNFLGATCLHDGPYMALYECFETFDAFDEILARGGEALPDAIRLLLAEYRRHALNRAWFYFPDALPAELLPPEAEVRNGHIDRKLSFPVEDLYGDGQPPGQVGQEIYGCGAPFTFATRAFHNLRGAPFLLFCEYRLADLVQAPGRVSFRLDAAPGYSGTVRLLPRGASVAGVKVEGAVAARQEGGLTFTPDAGRTIAVTWEPSGRSRPSGRTGASA